MEEPMSDVERAKNLYAIISNRELGNDPDAVQLRVNIVRELEKLTCSDFRDTADFNRQAGAFVICESSNGNKLRRFRQSKKWSQGELAIHLGVSQQFVAQMESGRRPLIDKALSLILLRDALPYAPTQFACETTVDSKQDTDAKKRVSDAKKVG